MSFRKTLEEEAEKFVKQKGYHDVLIHALGFVVIAPFAALLGAMVITFFSDNAKNCDTYCEQKKMLDIEERKLEIKEKQIKMEFIK